MTSPTLRPAIPADAARIIDVHRAAIRQSAAGYYSRDILEEWAPERASPERIEQFSRAIGRGDEIVLVAVDDRGQILGHGSIVPRSEELRAVYVDPKNGRQGLGRRILRKLQELAVQAGIKELRMDASLNAEAFYRANGFTSEGRGEHLLSSGGRMACVRMRKSLSLAT